VEDWKKAMDNLVRYRFQPFDPKSGKTQSFGWVLLTDPFSTEFTKSAIYFGEDIVGLTMRMDSVSVPASQVKLHLGRRVRQELAGSGKESLPKAELSRIKEDVIAELMSHSLPTIKLYEMVYNARRNRLWFFGKAKGVVTTFVELFNETFGLTMTPDSPFSVARDILSAKEAEKLLELGETGFVRPDA